MFLPSYNRDYSYTCSLPEFKNYMSHSALYALIDTYLKKESSDYWKEPFRGIYKPTYFGNNLTKIRIDQYKHYDICKNDSRTIDLEKNRTCSFAQLAIG